MRTTQSAFEIFWCMAEWVVALGLMSGTSMDGIDIAIVETDGISLRHLGPATTVPYEESFRIRLAALV